MHHLYIHSSLNGHLSHLHLLTAVTSAALNVCKWCIFLCLESPCFHKLQVGLGVTVWRRLIQVLTLYYSNSKMSCKNRSPGVLNCWTMSFGGKKKQHKSFQLFIQESWGFRHKREGDPSLVWCHRKSKKISSQKSFKDSLGFKDTCVCAPEWSWLPGPEKDSLKSLSLSLWLPRWLRGKKPLCQCRRYKSHRFNPRIGKIPWRRAWQHTPVFLPGESHGQGSPVGCSPGGRRELASCGSSASLKWNINTHLSSWDPERHRCFSGSSVRMSVLQS